MHAAESTYVPAYTAYVCLLSRPLWLKQPYSHVSGHILEHRNDIVNKSEVDFEDMFSAVGDVIDKRCNF